MNDPKHIFGASVVVVIRVILFACVVVGGLRPCTTLADTTSEADSRNWWFWKYLDVTGLGGGTNYYSATNALASTFSYELQAWNEGGTSGLTTHGPDNKFDNVGGAPAAKDWAYIHADVPAPGTTEARATGFGHSSTDFLAIYGRYYAAAVAHAEVKEATIPTGGFGRAKAKVKDPWYVDLPFAADPLDEIQILQRIDISGSDLQVGDILNSGSLSWRVALEGAPGYESYVFDYSLSKENGVFESSLLVAPGVHLYLNDFSESVEFDPMTEVTASELKDYLDSFNVLGGGWSLGGTPVLIGLAYTIANDAPGVFQDSETRRFVMHIDNAAETAASRPVPEAGSLLLAGIGLSLLVPLACRPRTRNRG